MMQILLCLFLILTIIGGLNWGAHAAGYNLVELAVPAFANYVYYLVAVSSLIVLVSMLQGNIKCVATKEKYEDLGGFIAEQREQ
jgi:uncharacterized membrane protein YuzA (DUF378 family)